MANANRIVQAGYGSHLLLAVKLLGTNPVLQFLALLIVGTVVGIDEHVGLLVRRDVTANGFAEDLRVAIDVEQVVLQLEGQSHLFANTIQSVGILFGRIGQQGTRLQRTGQQYAGLQSDHLDILVLRHVVARLEGHVVLLALANLQGCLCEEIQHGRQLLGRHLLHALIGQHQHGVAR